MGIVSFILRAGSMIVSMMSTMPLWRSFDPVAIFTGKKQKEDPEQSTDSDKQLSETLFDGDSK